MKVFIVCELDTWLRNLNSGFRLNDCLFGGFKLATFMPQFVIIALIYNTWPNL